MFWAHTIYHKNVLHTLRSCKRMLVLPNKPQGGMHRSYYAVTFLPRPALSSTPAKVFRPWVFFKNLSSFSVRLWSPSHCLGRLSIAGGLGFYFLAQSKISVSCEKLKLSHKSRIGTVKEEVSARKEAAFNWEKFFKFVQPDVWLFVLATISAFAAAFVNIRIPMLLGELVNSIATLIREADRPDLNVFNELYNPCKRLLWNYGLQAVFTCVYISLLSSFGERLATRLRTELFTSLITQDVAFFDTHKTGEVISRLTSDIQDFKSSFKQVISQGLRNTTQILGCGFTLYAISPKLTSLMLLLLPGVILIGTGLGSLLRQISRRSQEQVAIATSIADEAIANLRTVRAFAMEFKEIGWFNAEVQKAQTLNEILGAGIGVFQGLSNLAINGIVLVVLYTGTVLMDNKELTAGDLMSYLVATQTVQRSLGNMSVLFGQIVRGMSAGARVFEYMDSQPSIRLFGGKIIPGSEFKGNIRLRDVMFSYPSRPDQLVLDGLSLEVGSGKTVALVGASGSGKSTVVSLLERFYDIDSGSITLDGVEIRDVDPSWLRGDVIGFINQEPVLFATSVLENIRYGCPTASDREVYEAAKKANADDFIRGFPQGYDTIIGERGATVSGGQKQRIAIARALLKNPRILILDEATSALDAESERVVQDALDKLVEGRTVIVIAHRLSTVQNADVIAVISKGKVVETGTHQELLDRKGFYAELVRRQRSDLHEA